MHYSKVLPLFVILNFNGGRKGGFVLSAMQVIFVTEIGAVQLKKYTFKTFCRCASNSCCKKYSMGCRTRPYSRVGYSVRHHQPLRLWWRCFDRWLSWMGTSLKSPMRQSFYRPFERRQYQGLHTPNQNKMCGWLGLWRFGRQRLKSKITGRIKSGVLNEGFFRKTGIKSNSPI